MRLICGDAREILAGLPEEKFHACITSPPYWGLRDYGCPEVVFGGNGICEHEWGPERVVKRGHPGDKSTLVGTQTAAIPKAAGRQGQFCQLCGAWRGQFGLEPTPEMYVEHTIEFLRAIRRVLREDGVVFWVIGDSYSGGHRRTDKAQTIAEGNERGLPVRHRPSRDLEHPFIKPKDLVMIPFRVALAAQADGWWVRSVIIWSKPNPMPESVRDRPTGAHEYVLLLAKGQWKTRIVSLADLPSERVHFCYDFRLDSSYSGASVIGIRLAASILDLAQSEYDLRLSPFDPQIGQECADSFNGHAAVDLPVIHRAALIAARFLGSHSTAKEFLGQLNRLGIALSDGQHLLIGGGAAKLPLPPGIYGDGEGTIAVHHSGQICKFDFIHASIITQSPRDCKYYYDADPIREPHKQSSVERDRAGYKAAFKGRHTMPGEKRPHSTDHNGFLNASGRNKRTVWEIATEPFKGPHYATYPRKLVEPMVLTTPIKVCAECGAGWERIVEKGLTAHDGETRSIYPEGSTAKRLALLRQAARGRGGEYHNETRTLGFRPTCSCPGLDGDGPGSDCADYDTNWPTKPATILDPFCGTGTTCLVAAQHGRDWIGIDIDPKSIEMAKERLGLFA